MNLIDSSRKEEEEKQLINNNLFSIHIIFYIISYVLNKKETHKRTKHSNINMLLMSALFKKR